MSLADDWNAATPVPAPAAPAPAAVAAPAPANSLQADWDAATPITGAKSLADRSADRTEADINQAISGPLEGFRNVLGTFGDVGQSIRALGGTPPQILEMAPTREDVGRRVSNFMNLLGLRSELPDPTTPEGQYIRSGTRGAAMMVSKNPLMLGIGAVSGLTGEGLSHFLEGDQPAGKGQSLIRTIGEAVPLGLTGIMRMVTRPSEVASIEGGLARLGDTKREVYEAIDRAQARADVAAQALQMPHTSLWAQLPELNPEIKSLRESSFGKLVNQQVADEMNVAAIMGDPSRGGVVRSGNQWVDPLTKATEKPVWASDTAGWVDPKEAIANLTANTQATSPDIQSTFNSSLGKSVGAWLLRNIHPGNLLESFSKFYSGATEKSGLTGLGEKLAGPDAAEALKDAYSYSRTVNAIKALRDTLLQLQGGSAPAAQNQQFRLVQ